MTDMIDQTAVPGIVPEMHRVYSWNGLTTGMTLIRVYGVNDISVHFLSEAGVRRKVSLAEFREKARTFTLRQLMFWKYPRIIY